MQSSKQIISEHYNESLKIKDFKEELNNISLFFNLYKEQVPGKELPEIIEHKARELADALRQPGNWLFYCKLYWHIPEPVINHLLAISAHAHVHAAYFNKIAKQRLDQYVTPTDN